MAIDDERLAVLIEARVREFEKSLQTVERKVSKMGRGISEEMKSVERRSTQAAHRMEAEFAQATTGVAGKLRALKMAGNEVQGIFGRLGPASGLVGLAGGLGVREIVSQVNTATEAIADMRAEAERAGLSFEQFQELKFAFGKERVSVDALTDGFKELNLRAAEFIETGAGPGAAGFQRLGFSADELTQKLQDAPELFLDILARIQRHRAKIAEHIVDGLSTTTPEQLELFDPLNLPKPA